MCYKFLPHWWINIDEGKFPHGNSSIIWKILVKLRLVEDFQKGDKNIWDHNLLLAPGFWKGPKYYFPMVRYSCFGKLSQSKMNFGQLLLRMVIQLRAILLTNRGQMEVTEWAISKTRANSLELDWLSSSRSFFNFWDFGMAQLDHF